MSINNKSDKPKQKQKESSLKDIMDSQERVRNAEMLAFEQEKKITKHISFEVYKRTDRDKQALADARAEHNKELKKYGLSPSKVLNISAPMFMYWSINDVDKARPNKLS